MGDAKARQDETPHAPGPGWQRTIADVLAARGVTVAAYVPATGCRASCGLWPATGFRMRSLTREEECVGYAAGQRVAGGRPVDDAYGITGRQPLSSPPRFADVAQSLGGIAGRRVQDDDQLRTALIQLPRPSLIEAVVTDANWPGPSPFVDPALVRLAFSANATRVSGPGS